MTIDQLLALIQTHQWPLILAMIVGTVVRYSKPDVIFPSLPGRWRPLLAVVAGLAGSGAEAVFAGTPWRQALETGMAAALLAIVGHVFGIDVLRNGKEIPMPGLSAPPDPPSGLGRLDTLRADGTVMRTHLLVPPDSAAFVALALLLAGCTALRAVNDARQALCSAIGSEREAELDAEAARVGMSPTEMLEVWRATCLVRIEAAEREAVGAIGGGR